MPLSVLLVDADPATRAGLRSILEPDGYQVEEAGTAAAALARDDWGRFGAVLLDRRLPDGTAEDLLPRLREQAPDAAVVVVTGHADVHAAVAAFRLGAADYVLKPIDPDEIRARLGRVAEDRRARAAPRREEAELRAVLDALPVGVWLAEAAGRVVYSNPAGRRIWSRARGAEDEGHDGHPGWWADTGRQVGPVEWARARAIRGETVLDEMVEIEAIDGVRKVVLSSAVPLRAADGTVRGAVLIHQDVTGRKRAEDDLRARTEELRETTQQLWQAAKLAGVGELAASIAHELNNPLGTVALRLEGVLARTPADDPRRRPLEVIDQEVRRMADLVANLLSFSRAGQEQATAVDVSEEVARTIELADHHLSRHRVRVEPEFSPAVPAITADRQQLRQVLLNLFTNAGDAMPDGGRLAVRVRPGVLGERPAVVVEVADTGVGILPEHLTRIFDPFFTTKEEGQGTGLGLAICKQIIEQHKGALEIDSQVGSGTTVRVTLPALASAATGGVWPE